jgi:hypothetical protein
MTRPSAAAKDKKPQARKKRDIAQPFDKKIQARVIDRWRARGYPDTLVTGVTRFASLVILAPGLPVGFIKFSGHPWTSPTPAQREFGEVCLKLGVPYAAVSDLDQSTRVLEAWGVVDPQPDGAPTERPVGPVPHRRKR